MKHTQSQKRIRLITCLTASASLAAALWLSWPRERMLLELAHPLVSVNMPMDSCYWLSNHQLLIVTSIRKGGRGYGNILPQWQYSADLFDINTRTRTRLAGLTNLWNQSGLTSGSLPSRFELSPNGTWLHCQTFRYNRENVWNVDQIVKMDGSQHREWNAGKGWPNFWMDDQHYVQVERDSSGYNALMVNVQDAYNADADRRYPPSSLQGRTILAQYEQVQPLESIISLHTIDQSHYLIQCGHYEKRERRFLVHTHTVKLPDHTQPIEAVVSRLENAIIYHVRMTNAEPLLAWLHRFLPSFPANPTVTEGLWISRTDGTGMHELGQIQAVEGKSLEDLKWLPNNRQFSFVYRGVLYEMPIVKL